jgi:nitrogen-specific signal transduction histidine kinase
MTTTATPTRAPVLNLLDQLSEPLLVYNVAGLVMFANKAARALPTKPAERLSGHEDVKALVRDVVLGKTRLPQPMELAVRVGETTLKFQGQMVPGPAGVDMALVLPVAPASIPSGEAQLSLRQIMELLQSELAPPIKDFLRLIGNLQDAPQHADLGRAGRALENRLSRLVDMVNVFGDDVLIEDERIVVTDMVHALCVEMQALMERNRVTVVFQGDHDDLPPIYGSRTLIRRALWECLENAVLHSRKEVAAALPLAIEVRFRVSGSHLLIGIRNLGAVSVVTLTRRPFSASGESDSPPRPATPGLRIGLPLAQRILQLHGGRVRIEQEDQSELEVLLELPTGAPQRSTQKLDMLQAQAYAEDLSRLIARNRPRRS